MFKTFTSAALVAAASANTFITIEEMLTLHKHKADAPQCCTGACTKEGDTKYYSIDRIHHMCGECCMHSSDFLKYKLFEPGLKLATTDNMCASLNYGDYKETQTHGFGPIKMTVDLYAKPAKVSAALPPITPKAVGGFVAGLLDGFVEENHLKEIEGCFDNAKPLEADLAKALADAKAGSWADAVEQLMAVAQAFPAELATCKSATTDVSAVVAWAKGISKTTVEKNLLLHHTKIEADVKEVESDFTAGKYMDSGKAAADALMLVAGPVNPSKTVALPPITPKSVGGFVAGLLDGFVEENHLKEIEGCFDNAKPLEADLAKALADAKAQNWSDAISQLMAVVQAFPAELATCKSATTDISAVVAWAKGISKTEVEKNLLLHHSKIEADLKEVESDYTAGKYMDSGKAAADALMLVAGPVNPSLNVTLPPITPKAVGGFVAGLLDGFVEENHLKEIEGCFDNAKPLEADLAKALADAKAGSWADAVEQLMAVAQAFPAELATCKSATTDVSAVVAWAKGISKTTVEKNLLLHHTKIEADVKEVESDFTAGKYMDSGKAAADALMLVAGPVNPSLNVTLPPITPKAVGGFVAGLLDGFVEENHLKEIEGCFDNAKPLEADLAKALADAKAGSWADAVEQLVAVAQAFPAELATCKSATTDISAVVAWAKGITKTEVEKNLLLHHTKIEADVKEVESDFTAGKYMDSGKAAADALMLVAGPVTPAKVYLQ